MDYIPKVKPRIKRKKKTEHNSHRYTISKPKTNNEIYCLGEIWFGKTNNAFPSEWESCKANISSADDDEVDKLILYFGSTVVVITITTEVDFLKNLLSISMFNMDFKLHEENVMVLLYPISVPLPRFNAKIGSVMKSVFSIIFDITCDYNEIQIIKSSSVIESFTELYRNINNYQNEIEEIKVQHRQLKPELRKYQIDAVRWMMTREETLPENEILHPLYQEVKLPSDTIIYYDKHMGHMDLTKPMTNSLRTGGILADEMGLGKTVEVLACILSHPSNCKSSAVKNHSENPVIERQSRKRRSRDNAEDNLNTPAVEAKKLKVPDAWVKTSSRKSALFTALETWYTKELSVNRDAPEIPRVQCICGDTTERKDCVECCDCSKVQHGTCMGYDSECGEFCCPQCWMNRPLLETKATLIVTPQSLRQQWCDEIRKHIKGPFAVFLYEGGQNLTPIYPTKLTKYDVVITTYNVLQNELRLSENGQVISLRRPPKYSLPGSPVTRLNWWRLCLDEAQTVETPGRMVSAMARKIHAQHRWAVTGTPISKDICDLYGLIDYLQFSPYSEWDTWNNLLYKPYINGRKESMHRFLAKILWRMAKIDVIDQINIPQQTFAEHWLEFSSVEKFYYRREHELCSKEFLARLKQMDPSILLNSLNKSVLKKLLQPLLALRQACCHHQAVRGKYLANRKQVNSMEDLLDALIAKNINENEEYLRVIVSSLNGLAGIYLLLENPTQAAEEYRKVLQLSTRFSDEKNEVNLEIDKLQLIHTMHNLSEILEMYAQIPPTLRDSTLREECKVLEKEYLERFAKQTLTVLEDSLKFSKSIERLQSKFILNPGQWFADTIDWITTNSLFEEYLGKLINIMHSANVTLKDMSERKVLYMIAVWDEDITTLKEATISSIHQLFQTTDTETKIVIPSELIEAATDCHLRPQEKNGKRKKRCGVCDANFNLKQYESKIFSTTQKDDDFSNAGSWKPAPEEFMLRALHALGKQKNLSSDLLHDAETHFRILDILRKEFKEIRKLWTYIDAQVCAKDEVSMCKMRLQLKENTERSENDRSKINRIMKQLTQIEQNRFQTIHMLEEHELLFQKAVLRVEYETNTVSLEKNFGTYKYLQTLRKQQITGQTPDPCPICKNTLEKQWNILPCGHCYCLECIQILLEQTVSRYISCSICRSEQLIADISLLHTDKQVNNAEEGEDEMKITGNHSTKVEAVVRLVKRLKQKEENVKVLVFSHWTVILKVLHEVMDSNGVKSEILQAHNFEKILRGFKDESRAVTALLLPINLGAKGLNLIEATHVIFVEPLLNPGDELQAIGRVHRIGQTKPTVVHKFFIRNTIEENIQNATATNAEEWDSNKLTLGRIKRLFEVDSNADTNNTAAEVTESVSQEETATDNVES